jgi:superfamily II DNA or RNA helicase/HKD family nuclease
MTLPDPLRPGLYDNLVDRRLRELLEALGDELTADEDSLDPADVPDRLSRLFADALQAGLASMSKPEQRLELVRELRSVLARTDGLLSSGELELDNTTSARLLEIRPSRDGLALTQPTKRPTTPLADSALLMNAPGEPALAQELQAELASADRVDLLIAFVKWSGIRLVEDALKELIQNRGGRVRVLTTTYTGASEANALAALARWGADVRISFDNRRTRLHAKSWIFHRESGASTAYIGSSNLSSPALLEGLEWNVRLAALESPTLLEKISAAFESHWESEEFHPFDPDDADQMEAVNSALSTARGEGGPDPLIAFFDLKPYGYQRSMLDALEAERLRGHTKNLVVAPTGVGKTMVAAFDYARLERRPRLLFVAHRERLLDQSISTFRHVLKSSDFGEKLVGGHAPSKGDHVFASIQSLNAQGRIAALDPEHYEVVVVDEFHHAEAPTYERLLEHVRPRILVGLTATPERHDGKDVRRWFEGRTAYEMRLWNALDLGLLAPFHYFGIHDNEDLSTVGFTRGRYDAGQLSRLYTGNDARALLVLKEVDRVVGEPNEMRALGFCVSVDHARFMAERFTRSGLPSVAVTGDSSREERELAIKNLEEGSLNVLFTVDLFNEGVDIPAVDTVLFLRPTESATVFLQQLGRGLRIHDGKACLTVLDFIGNAHSDFRFDLRYRALLGGTAKQVREQVEADFPYLPAGCAMRLDRVAREAVLNNIRSVATQGKRWLAQELRSLGPDVSLADFLHQTGTEPLELYDGTSRSFSSLKRDTFGGDEWTRERRKRFARLAALLHVTDDQRLGEFRRVLAGEPRLDPRSRRLHVMLATAFFDREPVEDVPELLGSLRSDSDFVRETLELLDLLDDQRREAPPAWMNSRNSPLAIHGRYRREEVLAALDIERNGKIPRVQAGVFHEREQNVDLLFVTLRKTERGFSPKTMYRDYAISPKLFHWESQHTAHAKTRTGKRYIDGTSLVLLFVRQHQKLSNGLAEPFVFLGPAKLRSWRGDRPMQIEWELENAMPGWLYREAAVLGS